MLMPDIRVWCVLGGCVLGGAALAAGEPAQAGKAKAAAPAPAAMTVADVRACMSRNLVDKGAVRDLDVKATNREGKEHALRMRFLWKPAKNGDARVNLKLVEPAAMQGSSYLLVQQGRQEEVYFFLPTADRPLRITGQNMAEPLWGTDFSYGEIKQVLGLLVSGETQRKPDAKVGGRDAYVLETATSLDDTGYTKVVNYVDQKGCVLLKSEFFAKSGKPRKLLEGDLSTLLTAEAYTLVLGYTMRDLQQGTRTQVTLSDFSLDERLPERLFDPKRFQEPFE